MTQVLKIVCESATNNFTLDSFSHTGTWNEAMDKVKRASDIFEGMEAGAYTVNLFIDGRRMEVFKTTEEDREMLRQSELVHAEMRRNAA